MPTRVVEVPNFLSLGGGGILLMVDRLGALGCTCSVEDRPLAGPGLDYLGLLVWAGTHATNRETLRCEVAHDDPDVLMRAVAELEQTAECIGRGRSRCLIFYNSVSDERRLGATMAQLAGARFGYGVDIRDLAQRRADGGLELLEVADVQTAIEENRNGLRGIYIHNGLTWSLFGRNIGSRFARAVDESGLAVPVWVERHGLLVGSDLDDELKHCFENLCPPRR